MINMSINKTGRAKLIFIMSATVSLFWCLGQLGNVYQFSFIGAVFRNTLAPHACHALTPARFVNGILGKGKIQCKIIIPLFNINTVHSCFTGNIASVNYLIRILAPFSYTGFLLTGSI